MAISATATTNLDRDTVITTAAQRASMLNAGQSLDAAQKQLFANFLWMRLQAIQSRGVQCRMVERTTVTLTPSVAYVDLAADTVSVESGITVRSSDGTDLPVVTWSRQQYERQPNKAVEGRPVYAYAEELSTEIWRLFLWPVPTSDWASLTYPRVRRSRDVSQGNYNLDIDRRALMAIVLALGADIAGHFGNFAKSAELNNLAEAELAIFIGDDTQKGPTTFEMYSTPWDY